MKVGIFSNIVSFLRRYVIVNHCLGCGYRIGADETFCHACLLDYESGRSRECGRCKKLLSECTCAGRFLMKKRVRRLHKLLPYRPGQGDNGINRMVLRMKKQNPNRAFEFCAAELAVSMRGKYRKEDGWCLTFAPRTVGARIRYGYDQSERLARRLAKELDLPFLVALKRKRKSKSQKGLSHTARKENAKGTFVAKGELPREKRILLLDDVVTTGASLGDAASALYEAGACVVVGVCLCVATKL